MKKKQKHSETYEPDLLVTSMLHPHPAKNDPAGSWTGIPGESDEIPEQDADDL